MKYYLVFICLILSTSSFAQKKYIQKQDGQIVDESTFYKEKNELVQKFKEKTSPDKYFDIIYEFEEPIISQDSIIYKVRSFALSSLPPQINRKNIFNEKNLIGKPLSIKSLETINGEILTIKDLTGKPSIVNFWHTGCGPCIREMPILNELSKEYEGKVNFIAITFETKEKVDKFLTKRDFDFLQTINAADFMNSIQFREFPKTFYLDKNGIVTKIEGAISDDQKEEFRNYLNSLL